MSFTSLLICFAMLAGSTFAWFTDTATTGVNKITSGNLHEIQNKDNQKIETLEWVTKEGAAIVDQDKILWEPGCTYLLTPFKIVNTGNLALKYKIVITGPDGDSPLLDVIEFTYKGKDGNAVDINAEGHMTPVGTDGAATALITVSAHMDKAAGNDYQDKTLENVKFTVYATQDTVENDSYGPTYDKDATYYPVLDADGLKDALVNGGNITIAGDFTGDATKTEQGDRLTIKTPTTLNFEGVYTVPGSLEDSNNWAALYITDETTINAIDGAGIICEDKTDSSATYIGGPFVADVNAPDKTVTVNGGTYYGGGTTFQVTKGTLVVNGGFFKCAPDIGTNDYRYLLNCYDANHKNSSAKIIVKGGTFVNYDPSHSDSENPQANFVAEGYSVISEQHGEDTWYTVVRAADSATALQEAIKEGAPYIQLTKNVDVTEALTFENETTIDLNDKTLSSSMESGYSLVLKGDTVIKNGTYQGNGTARGIAAYGNLTLESVKVDVAGQVGVACSENNCTYNIQDSEIKGDYALANFANNATVTIQDSTLEGKTCGLYHNGSNSGLNLNVTDTKINGGNDGEDATGVYISGSTVTVAAGGYQQATFTNCSIEGATAVEVKHSDVKLTDCTLTATGDPTDYTQNNNGSTAVGYCFATTSNSKDGKIDPSSGTIEFENCTFVPKVSGCEVFNSYADASGNQGATIKGYDNSKILYPNKLTPNS